MSDCHQTQPSGSDHKANFPASGSCGAKATTGQFGQEVIMGYQIKSFFEVKIYDINLISLVQVIGHLVIEGNEIGQTRPTHNKPMLAIP